ncbi:MAG: hypothetical protein V1855_04890, partial [bacterium]
SMLSMVTNPNVTSVEFCYKLSLTIQNDPLCLLKECMDYLCPFHRGCKIKPCETHPNGNHHYRDCFEKQLEKKITNAYSNNNEPIDITFFGSRDLFQEFKILSMLIKNKIKIQNVYFIDIDYKKTISHLLTCISNSTLSCYTWYRLHEIEKLIGKLKNYPEEKEIKKMLLMLCRWCQFVRWFKDQDINFNFFPSVHDYLKNDHKSDVIIGFDFEDFSHNIKFEKTKHQNQKAHHDFSKLCENGLVENGIIAACWYNNNNKKIEEKIMTLSQSIHSSNIELQSKKQTAIFSFCPLF